MVVVGVVGTFPDQRSTGRDARPGGDHQDGAVRFAEGEVEELVRRAVEGDLDLGALGQGGEVARAEALADLLEDRLVLDDGDEEFDLFRLVHVHVVEARFRRGGRDGELAAADQGEEPRGLVPGKPDRGEVGEDFEDAASWAGGVVEEFVRVEREAELLETLAVSLVRGEVGHVLEKVALGQGGYVEVVGEQIAKRAA